jgi:hypothetical protein
MSFKIYSVDTSMVNYVFGHKRATHSCHTPKRDAKNNYILSVVSITQVTNQRSYNRVAAYEQSLQETSRSVAYQKIILYFSQNSWKIKVFVLNVIAYADVRQCTCK